MRRRDSLKVAGGGAVGGLAMGVKDYCMSSTLVTMMVDGLAKKHKLKLRDRNRSQHQR